METLSVYWGKEYPVGSISRHRQGKLIFQYSQRWLSTDCKPISLSLPCQSHAFPPGVSTAFFENLLPENEAKHILAFNKRFDPKDTLAFLRYFGKDCAGALSILPESEKPDLKFGKYSKIDELLADALVKKAHQPENHKLFVEVPGARLSIAGAQDKLPVFYDQGHFFLPENTGSPTSHIIKPQSSYFQDIQRNEAYCMDLASCIGLSVPCSKLLLFEGHELFIVERFDRCWQKDDLSRIHQEDFCQALGYTVEQKYQEQGGPGFEKCRSVLDEYLIDNLAEAKRSLVSIMFYNYSIGNNDAHAKNFSLLHTDDVELAPFYDLVSSQVYPSLDRKTAMSIGGTYRNDNLKKSSIIDFAKHMKLRPQIVIEILDAVVEKVDHQYETILSRHEKMYGESEIYLRLHKVITDNLIMLKNIRSSF